MDVTLDTQNNLAWELGMDGDNMDVQYVTAGWLTDPTTMPPGVKQKLDAAGLNSDDYNNILKLNPFIPPPSVPVFGGGPGNAGGGPTPTPNLGPSRYLLVQGVPFDYEPPQGPSGTGMQNYKLTNTLDITNADETQTQEGLTVTSSTAGLAPLSLTLTESLQWTYTASLATESKSSQSAAVAIGGPSSKYAGPTGLRVYWDILFSTFAFMLD